jgi:hypothetical protein
VWGKCEKPKSAKNVKYSRGKILQKNVEKIGVEKKWINDLEEVKSVVKCQCGKKRENFPWKNITYLVVVTGCLQTVKPVGLVQSSPGLSGLSSVRLQWPFPAWKSRK